MFGPFGSSSSVPILPVENGATRPPSGAQGLTQAAEVDKAPIKVPKDGIEGIRGEFREALDVARDTSKDHLSRKEEQSAVPAPTMGMQSKRISNGDSGEASNPVGSLNPLGFFSFGALAEVFDSKGSGSSSNGIRCIVARGTSSGLLAVVKQSAACSFSAKPLTNQLKLRSRPTRSCLTPGTISKESKPPTSIMTPYVPSWLGQPSTAPKYEKGTLNKVAKVVGDLPSSLQPPILTKPPPSKDHPSAAPVVG